MDDSLPFMLNIFLANAFRLAGILVVLCCAQPAFVLLLVPLAFIYRSIQVRSRPMGSLAKEGRCFVVLFLLRLNVYA